MDEEHAAIGPHVHGEHGEIHLPPPSYWPVVMAIGITTALAGVVINTFVWIAGVLIILAALGGWMIELGRDLEMAPDDVEP